MVNDSVSKLIKTACDMSRLLRLDGFCLWCISNYPVIHIIYDRQCQTRPNIYRLYLRIL